MYFLVGWSNCSALTVEINSCWKLRLKPRFSFSRECCNHQTSDKPLSLVHLYIQDGYNVGLNVGMNHLRCRKKMNLDFPISGNQWLSIHRDPNIMLRRPLTYLYLMQPNLTANEAQLSPLGGDEWAMFSWIWTWVEFRHFGFLPDLPSLNYNEDIATETVS